MLWDHAHVTMLFKIIKRLPLGLNEKVYVKCLNDIQHRETLKVIICYY